MNLEKENMNYISLAQEMLLFKGLIEWRKNPDKSLRKIIKDSCKYDMKLYQNFNSKQLLEACISSTISNLLRQNFVTCYDFLRHNMDDKMPTKLKQLRDALSKSKTNLNTLKLLDIIRQSFAHNDIKAENPNWTLNSEFKIEINFKGNQFEFDFVELHDLFLQFLSLKNNDEFFTYGIKFNKLITTVIKNKLTPDNIPQLVTQYKDGTENEIIPLDKYQKHALYNLFYNKGINVENHIRLLINNKCHALSQCFPLPGYFSHIIKNNNIAIRQLFWLNKNFMSRHQFLEFCYNAEGEMTLIDSDNLWNSTERQDYALFVHENSFIFDSILLNNIMFNIFSMSHPHTLIPYFKDLNIDMNRVRNSYMHGRFYYNHNKGIEFYDGINNNNLTHIASLSFDNILNICSEFIENNLSPMSSLPKFETLVNPT